MDKSVQFCMDNQSSKLQFIEVITNSMTMVNGSNDRFHHGYMCKWIFIWPSGLWEILLFVSIANICEKVNWLIVSSAVAYETHKHLSNILTSGCMKNADTD